MSANPIMRYFSPDGETTFDIQDARTGKINGMAINNTVRRTISSATYTETVSDVNQLDFLLNGGECNLIIMGSTKYNGETVDSLSQYSVSGVFEDDGQGGYIYSPDESYSNHLMAVSLTDNGDDTGTVTIAFDERSIDSLDITYTRLVTRNSIQNTWDMELIPVDELYQEIVARLEEDGYITPQMQI